MTARLISIGILLHLVISPAVQGAIVHVFDQPFTIEGREEPGHSESVLISFGGSESPNVGVSFWQVSGLPPPWVFSLFGSRFQFGGTFSSPLKLDEGAVIDGGISWTSLDRGAGPILLRTDGSGVFYDAEGFFGIRVLDESAFIYGWLRMSHDAEAGLFTVHDWAWNSIPNEPIRAGEVPEPATVALLFGIGALVLALTTRRRARAALSI